jgi:D-alanyl-D-alanine carboxypeptidase (penicillin-binding protein 5/6)
MFSQKVCIHSFLIFLFFPLLLSAGSAVSAPPAIPGPPELPVRGYILLDFHSGSVIAEKDSDLPMEPASITKLMSAYVVYQKLAEGKLQLSDKVRISHNAFSQEGSRMFLEEGSMISIADLLLGVVVQSGNDATVALAEHIAGSETAFAELMNEQAAALGLQHTHFVNSTGLPDPQHFTTAHDIALLVRYLIADFPDQYADYSVRSFTHNDITQANRNKLLWQDESVDGVKTGHTSSAGYCLVASAQRQNTRLISVVLGAVNEDNRFSASQDLLDYGFRYYQTSKLYDAGYALTDVQVWKGEVSKLQLGFNDTVYVTIPKDRYQDMQASLRVNNAIEAPVQQGQVFGSVIIQLDNKPIAEIPLVALANVAPAGFFGRMTDEVLLMINSLFD